MAEEITETGEGNQPAGGLPQDERGQAGRTFTQEDVDRIVRDRLARAKAQPPSDYEELKKKAALYDEAQEAAKSELERAEERASRAERALAEAQERAEHAALVAKVSEETGVPASLLHGSTEEELASSARAVSDYARSRAYPQDKGGSPAGREPVSVQSIESIRNPVERVRQRARHRDLYQQ